MESCWKSIELFFSLRGLDGGSRKTLDLVVCKCLWYEVLFKEMKGGLEARAGLLWGKVTIFFTRLLVFTRRTSCSSAWHRGLPQNCNTAGWMLTFYLLATQASFSWTYGVRIQRKTVGSAVCVCVGVACYNTISYLGGLVVYFISVSIYCVS